MIEIKDKTGQTWTQDEIQALVCQVGSLTKAARRLGLRNTSELRKLEILTATEWVRKRAKENPNWLRDLIIRFDSKKKAALHQPKT